MIELPEVDELRVARFILEGRDPFAFGRRKHRRIKALNTVKRKRGKGNGRAKATKAS